MDITKRSEHLDTVAAGAENLSRMLAQDYSVSLDPDVLLALRELGETVRYLRRAAARARSQEARDA